MKRGDIILVPFPFQDKLGEKIRPAVVVQSDAETARLINTVVAMITGNTDDAGRPTTLLVDPSTPEGSGSGLAGPSLIKAYNLATVRQKRVIATLGHLSDVLKNKLDACLQAALELP